MKTSQLKRVCLLVGLVFLGAQLFAQNSFEIRGKIVKSDRPEENYASVTLLDAGSMEIVANQICGEKGEFVIENLTKGNYILVVQKPGFHKPERRFISISGNGKVIQTADLEKKKQTTASNEMM